MNMDLSTRKITKKNTYFLSVIIEKLKLKPMKFIFVIEP